MLRCRPSAPVAIAPGFTMHHPIRHRLPLRAPIAALLISGVLAAPSSGDLQGQIAAGQSAAGALQSQIAAETARIHATANGIEDAGRRLAALQAQLSRRVAELTKVQLALIAARDRLVALENRLELATRALAGNLVSQYEGNRPDLVTVILDSRGFSDLLEKVDFLQRMARSDAQVLGATRAARKAVTREATALAALEQRDRRLTDQLLAQRNEVAALRAALLTQQISQVAARNRNQAQLAKLNTRLRALEAKAAAEAASGNAAVGGIAIDTHGMVQPPPGAPPAVAQVIAAANAIATLPYVWGGGHGSFQASGYDCSGSVSYALAAAGLLSSPLDSTGFMSWGDPGPGRWITVYANPGHAWMEVAGWRFDTVALADGGTRWAQGGGEFAGFVARHPPGL